MALLYNGATNTPFWRTLLNCETCEFLRSKLSPLEDKEFTSLFRQLEPSRKWYASKVVGSKRGTIIKLTLPELWEAAFGEVGNMAEITKLGRTLLALGWTRTKTEGRLFFTLPLEELSDYINLC